MSFAKGCGCYCLHAGGIHLNDAVAYDNLGCVYWNMNNWSAAVDAWENCVRLIPDQQTARMAALARKQLRRCTWR